jgi:hypothetical protein
MLFFHTVCPALVVEAAAATPAMEGDGIPVVDLSSLCDHALVL